MKNRLAENIILLPINPFKQKCNLIAGVFGVRSAENICAVCNDPIYNRICALCLTDKVESWLENKKLSLVKDFRNQVRQLLDAVKKRNRMFCVFCRIETEISICPICFTDKIAAWLNNKDISTAEEFSKQFYYKSPARQRTADRLASPARQPT